MSTKYTGSSNGAKQAMLTPIWTSVILAGGQSRRMGTSKALLPVGKQTMLQHQVQVLRPFSEQIVIVTRDEDRAVISHMFEEEEHIKIMVDHPFFKGCGPLVGMYTAMSHVDAEWYFVTACDLPNLNRGYLSGLAKRQASILTHTDNVLAHTDRKLAYTAYEAFIPVEGEHIHLFSGLYRSQTRNIHTLLSQGKWRGMDLLQKLNVYFIQEEEWREWSDIQHPFYNMNHPQDYQGWLDRQGGGP